MKKLAFYSFVFICVFCHLTSHAAPAHEISKEEMINHIQGIENIFHDMYAPTQWKKEIFQWDLKNAAQQAIDKVVLQENISLRDYHQILVRFFNSFKDYHVGIHFYATEKARLPFRVRGAEGRYFVVWVDEQTSQQLPFQVGDEILTFNGKPIAEEVAELILHDNRELINQSDLEVASIYLTMRPASNGYTVPSGPVELLIKSKQSGQTYIGHLQWDYSPERISGYDQPVLAKGAAMSAKPKKIADVLANATHNQMTAPFFSSLATDKSAQLKGAIPVGDKKGDLPFLGQPLWEAPEKNLFWSYIYQNKSGKIIGYLRIAHFKNLVGSFEGEAEMEELRSVIQLLQRKTDGLVLDITDNPGGFFHYLTNYLTLFIKEPIHFFKQRMALNQESIVEAFTFLEEIEFYKQQEPHPAEQQQLLGLEEYYHFIIDEWNAGRHLTQPGYLFGISTLTPDSEAYKKPIVLLVNSVDYSCADFFPAVIQDNNQATLFGVKTAGAGGVVLRHTYPNLMGIADYSYTGSLIERLNHEILENTGVTPDIIHQVTPYDLQYNYEEYSDAVNAVLDQLIGDVLTYPYEKSSSN